MLPSAKASAVNQYLFEGPCSIDISGTSPNGTNWNPYSWNNNANIFFLDQPYVQHRIFVYQTLKPPSVGVGYSYADFGETVDTTEEAARNVHAFLTIFFETFRDFSSRPLHLAGESYAVGTPSYEVYLFRMYAMTFLGALPPCFCE